jgi:hypothetical protein
VYSSESAYRKENFTMQEYLLIIVLTVIATLAAAKEKNKVTLPADVLNAHTVFVTILPNAGEPVTDPQANARARDDVERALMKWHRFSLVLDPGQADLVVCVKKGRGKAGSPTISGGPIDQRPVVVQPTDGGIRVGGHRGQPTDVDPQDPIDARPHAGIEFGAAEDLMEVHRGRETLRLATDSPSVWRYSNKDALRSPAVPAVDKFRKTIEESEKQAANKPQP